MVRRNDGYRASPGAASWWLLVALVLVASFGFYVRHQQDKAAEPTPRVIQVAVAESSGVLPLIDSASTPRRPDGTVPLIPAPPDTGPFIAPSPNFERSTAVPVANFLDYARRMLFDASRGMELTLPVDEYGRMRVVRLEPLANLRRLDSTAFAEGRIIARIRSDAALPALSIHNGENFVWLQGALGAPVQAEVWSSSVVVPPKALRLTYSPRAPVTAPEGKDAFWLGDGNDRVFWIACGRGWCHS